MNTKVEAQGGELVLRNAHGDVVIIPRNKRREALGYLAKGDHSAIDAIAVELPKASDYAMGGAVYDGGEDPIEGVMGPETTIVGKRPFSVKNFLNRWGKHHAENPSDNFFGALGQGLMAPLQLAQAGATYALTGGKEIEPGAALRGSKFTNFMNKLSNSPTMDPISKAAASALGSETGQNILFDPLNIPITKGVQAFSKTKPLGITEDIGSNLIRNGDVENAIRIPRKVIRGIENVFNKIGMQKTFNRLENIGYELSTLPKKLSPSYQRYADKVIDATKAGSKVLNKTDDVVNRLKFEDFNNENEFFRIIVGDDAYNDILKSGKVRVKAPSDKLPGIAKNMINLDRRGTTAFPSFSKGKPSLEYAQSNNNHYIIRTNDASINPSTSGRHGKGTTMFPTDDTGKHLKELDASKVQVYKHVGNGEYELVNTAKPIVSSVDDVGKQAPKQWQLEELPGLHLKSTMEGQAISKIVEPKTGLINVEQALGIIGKESGGADKVALVKQGLGENIPKKMGYNEFRKVIQDQLIPLETKINPTGRSEYGLERIGYYDEPPMDRGALTLSNKYKFGRGSSAHGNPEETLGHIHFLRDAETPDVLTVTQIQSDAFQGPYRIIPKTQQEALEKVSKLKEEGVEIKSMFGDGKESSNAVLANYEKHLQLDEASAKNFTQKQLLDKNHQERYLQELVDYAGKRGDVNKIRVPTSETAAKVQGYDAKKTWNTGSLNNGDNVILSDGTKGTVVDDTFNNFITIKTENGKELNIDFSDAGYGMSKQSPIKSVNNVDVKEISEYTSEHQTILKKYSEQPKTIKKLFGQESKIVTDSKGNTWYEFDIPKKFKQGKGEIKAFQFIPPAIGGAALYLQSQQSKNN